MAMTIDEVYVRTYENNVRHLAQQTMTKFRDWVVERGVQSEQHAWERVDSVDANLKQGPRTPTITEQPSGPLFDTPWSRRVSTPATYDVSDTVEQDDPTQMIIDPNSNIAIAQGNSMRRQLDDIIIAAAVGTAASEDDPAIVFPVSQVVGDGLSSITFDNVTEVNEIFMANDVDPDEEKLFAVGPKQIRKMLQMTEVTSVDYQNLKALSEGGGMVPNWMGFTWINSTRLNLSANSNIECFAMTRRALGLQINKDITAKIAEDPSLSFSWIIYCFLQAGCVRVEDEQIVKLDVLDAV